MGPKTTPDPFHKRIPLSPLVTPFRQTMKMTFVTLAFGIILALVGNRAGGEPAETAAVSLRSLLLEMADPARLARWPDPAYVSKQASSYDRRSTTPKEATMWFANGDNMEWMGAAPKWETHQGRQECVLLDAEGPGAVTRFWTGGAPPRGRVRFYLDGRDSPTIDAPLAELLFAKGFVPCPLAQETSGRAGNLYLPIPYAKSCKITYDEGTPPSAPPGRWYNIEYRRYASTAQVESFTIEKYNEIRPLVNRIAGDLAKPAKRGEGRLWSAAGAIVPPGRLALRLPPGPAAIQTLTVSLANVAKTDWDQTLRSVVIRAKFDGEETIWCPLGEFFGSGVGRNCLNSWTRQIDNDGNLQCSWVMPYKNSAELFLVNLGKQNVEAKLEAHVGEWTWDNRSMLFHCTWRYQRNLHTRPFSDFNYVTVEGRGVYVGDTLAVFNPNKSWWGEGDEKVWVDSEAFPSHFGTGTEDHYGYAWGDTAVFQGPFCNQPRAGRNNRGHVTNTRVRSLDAIPFTKSLKYDMELWHWADCQVDYSVAAYWYAKPGATSNVGPLPSEAGAKVPQLPPRVIRQLPGAIECESMPILDSSPGLATTKEEESPYEAAEWSNDAHLLVEASAPGQFVDLLLANDVAKPKKVVLHLTRCCDYGIVRLSLNGKPVKEYDCWHSSAAPSGPVDLGTVEPKDGKIVLRAEVIGTNPKSSRFKYYFGLDAVILSDP